MRSRVAAAIMPSMAVTQSTDISAQPRWLRRPSSGVVLMLLLFEQRLNFRKFVTKLIGYCTRFLDVVDHVRCDEHHQLIAVHGIVGVREQVTKIREYPAARECPFCSWSPGC